MRIGISINTGLTIWNNDLFQTIYHLATLLEAIPFVEKVFLLDCSNEGSHTVGAEADAHRFALVRLNEANDMIDVAIEVGGTLDPEWNRRLRARGGKSVFHICRQPYAELIEATVFGRSGHFGEPLRCDEVWVLPSDTMFVPMLRVIHRCAILEVPYIWSPRLLNASIEKLEGRGMSFGYQPGSLAGNVLRPAIFELNVSPTQMGLVPLLICQAMEDRHAGAIGRVELMNGEHMRAQRSFISFMKNLELYNSGRISINAPDSFAQVMGRGSNVVISHQLDCPQSNLYLDALNGAYPLVHNSPSFSDVGYYYAGSDIEGGVSALLRAMTEHDRTLDSYRSAAAAKIGNLSPTARGNIDAYARRLLALTGTRNLRGAA